MGVNFSKEEVDATTFVLGCQSQSLSFSFLGLSIGSSPGRKGMWAPMVAKFKVRFNPWRGWLLSFGGHLIMIKVILNGLSLCYISFYKMSKGVIRKLKRIRRKIL